MLAVSVTWIHKYTFLHIFIRTRQSKIKLLSGKIIVSKRIHVIKEERKINFSIRFWQRMRMKNKK